MEINLKKFNYKLLFPTVQFGALGQIDFLVPGNRRFFSVLLNDSNNKRGEIVHLFLIDTRSNTMVIKRQIEPFPMDGNIYQTLDDSEYSDVDKWVYLKFNEYKNSNFKFGDDMYEPTEQIEVDKFFNYLKSKIREEVIDSIK